MPIKIDCSNCGHELGYYGLLPAHASFDLRPYYVKIREKFNGKCPKCGHKLAKSPVNVEVKGA